MTLLDAIAAKLRAHGRDPDEAREWAEYGFTAREVDELLTHYPGIEPRDAHRDASLRRSGE